MYLCGTVGKSSRKFEDQRDHNVFITVRYCTYSTVRTATVVVFLIFCTIHNTTKQAFVGGGTIDVRPGKDEKRKKRTREEEK